MIYTALNNQLSVTYSQRLKKEPSRNVSSPITFLVEFDTEANLDEMN